MTIDITKLRELDGWRSAIAKEFPLYDEDGIDEGKHCCEWVILQERKRLHKILATRQPKQPEQPEQPADLARDAERYRWLRNWTRGAYGIDSNPVFILPHVPTMLDQNIMSGSVAQHLDNAIDAAIERDKLKEGNKNG